MKKLLITILLLICPTLVIASTYEITTPGNNVGIDSTSPGQALDVQGTVRSSSGFIGPITGANPTNLVSTFATNGTSTTPMRSDAAPAIDQTMTPTWTGKHIFNNSTTSFTTGAGNVGINSATPGQKLDVQGTVRATQFLGDGSLLSGIAASGWSTGSNKVYITAATTNVGVGSVSPGQILDVQGTVRSLHFVGEGSLITGIGGSISGLTTGDVIKAASSTTIANGAMFDNGNIGIGSTNPGQLLDVQGTIRASVQVVVGTGTASIQGDSNGNVGIGSATPGKTLDVAGTVRAVAFYGDGSNLTGVSAISGLTTNYVTKASSATAIANSLIFDNGTNVGIGSANPGQVLDVNGAIRSSIAGNATFNGNIGVGSTNPGEALDVQGSVRSSIFSGQADGIILCVKGKRIGYCSGSISSVSCTCN